MSSKKNRESRLLEATHYMEISRPEKAETILKDLLAENQIDSQVLYLLAVCQYDSDQEEEALSTCLEGMKYEKSSEDYHSLLGSIYFSLNQLSEAEESFLEALRINPNNPITLANYGYLMLCTGHKKKAAQLIEEALRLDPEDSSVLHYAFYYYLAKNNKHGEADALTNYIRFSSDEVGTLIKVGIADLVRGKTERARENFRQAYLLDPTNNSILDILNDLDEETHILFLPHRLMKKLGGPMVIWSGFIVLLMILRTLKFYSLGLGIAIGYIIFCIYTWIAPWIYTRFVKNAS